MRLRTKAPQIRVSSNDLPGWWADAVDAGTASLSILPQTVILSSDVIFPEEKPTVDYQFLVPYTIARNGFWWAAARSIIVTRRLHTTSRSVSSRLL